MNSLAILTVFTLKKGYARNVCDVSHFDTFAYFYAISNYYFNLRNADFKIPRFRTVHYRKHSLRDFGPHLWNKFVYKTDREKPSVQSFKKKNKSKNLNNLQINR